MPIVSRIRDCTVACENADVVHFNNEPGPEVPRGPRINDIREYRASFVGMVGLVCIPFLVFGAHAVYGTAATVGLAVWWLFLLSLGIAWFMHHPRRMPWLPALGFVAWLAAVLLARG